MNSVNCVVDQATVGRNQVLESGSPAEAQAIMSGYCCDHKLTVLETGPLRFRQSRHRLSNIEFCQVEYGAMVRVEYDDLKSFYNVSLPVSGEQQLSLGSCKSYSDTQCGMVISPTQVVSLEMSAECRKLLVKIPRLKMEAALQRLLGHGLHKPLVFESSMDLDFGEISSWWRTVKFMLDEQGKEGSLYQDGPMLEAVEQLLIEGLLLGQPHNYHRELEQQAASVLPAYVRRAENFILENAQKPITKKDIIEAAGVPDRTLYEGFKRFGKTSPMRYLKDLRMDRVREELLASDGVSTITDIAMRWWFTHLGRFSAEYKQRFGELPSETVKCGSSHLN